MDEHNPQNIAEMPSAFELFKPSWKAFSLNWVAFIVPALLPVALLAVTAIILVVSSSHNGNLEQNSNGVFTSQTNLKWNVLSVVLGTISVVMLIVYSTSVSTYVKLQSARNNRLTIKQAITQSLPFFWRLLGLGICRGFIILIGLIALIVPGLYFWKRYLLAPYYLMDENIGVFESMRRAAVDSNPFGWTLWGILGVSILIQVVGILPWIGWAVSLVAGLAYMCASAVRYYQIKAVKASGSVKN